MGRRRKIRAWVLLPVWWPMVLTGIVLYCVGVWIGYGTKDAVGEWKDLAR